MEENTEVNLNAVVSAATSAIVTVPAVAPVVAPLTGSSHVERPEKFGGLNLKRWQQKMLFYLTTLGLARMLTEEPPVMPEGDVDKPIFLAVETWKHSDFLCKNYILNCLENTIYDVYCTCNTAKTLWLALERKYKTEDSGTKKFIVGRFLDYKMVDSKTVIIQVEELQMIIAEIHNEGMSLSGSFQVACVIEKLPPLWKDFKSYLKHKRKEMKTEDLIVRLRIEESPRKDLLCRLGNPKRMSECRVKKKPQPKAHMADMADNDDDEMQLCLVVFECITVGNPRQWWVDTGATRHVYAEKAKFYEYKAANREQLFMGNSASTKIWDRERSF